jgi:hypothetical protein
MGAMVELVAVLVAVRVLVALVHMVDEKEVLTDGTC